MNYKFRKEKHIKQRFSAITKRWSFQVFIDYKDEDGRPQRYTKTFAEKDYQTARNAYLTAVEHRDDKLRDLRTTGIRKEIKATVDNVFDKSKEVFVKSPESQRKKTIRYNKYIKPLCGEKEIKKITGLDIYKSLNRMVDDSSDNTIRSVFTVWKEIFKTARIMNLVTIDCTEEIICPKSAVLAQKRSVETDFETLDKVISAIRKHGGTGDKSAFENEIIIGALLTMYHTGIRPAECFALEKSDILEKEIIINKSLGLDEKRKSYLRRTKTVKSNRVIPIVSELRPILDDLIKFQDSERLFARFDGEYFVTNDVASKIHRCCQKEGIEFNMYRLRHLFSTDLVTGGTDPRTVMEIMGHEEIGMTIEYARSSSDLKIKAMESRKK